LDLALVAMSAPFILPLLLVAAAWVALVSPGPVVFVQERVGQAGRRFRCLKLRTMRAGCPTSAHQKLMDRLQDDDQPMAKLDAEDPRLIPGARWIRALGIDELPQLWNVCRGEMSFVGPRPCVPYELNRYRPSQLARFQTLPGLTGLWQVRGKNHTTFSQMIRYDVEYARLRSLRMDVHILLSTPRTLVSQLRDAVQLPNTAPQPSIPPSSPTPALPMSPVSGRSS
jgi:lipopolysaccharide/colanic/teichoic acid biosynthesis glycosyltransferase